MNHTRWLRAVEGAARAAQIPGVVAWDAPRGGVGWLRVWGCRWRPREWTWM